MIDDDGDYEPDNVSPEAGSSQVGEEAEDDELMIGAGVRMSPFSNIELFVDLFPYRMISALTLIHRLHRGRPLPQRQLQTRSVNSIQQLAANQKLGGRLEPRTLFNCFMNYLMYLGSPLS